MERPRIEGQGRSAKRRQHHLMPTAGWAGDLWDRRGAGLGWRACVSGTCRREGGERAATDRVNWTWDRRGLRMGRWSEDGPSGLRAGERPGQPERSHDGKGEDDQELDLNGHVDLS